MGYEKFAHELLVGAECISCIYEEDFNGESGITVLYNEGTSFWRPIGSREARKEVWEKIVQMRPPSLAEFEDSLVNPEKIQTIGVVDDGYGDPEVVVSFVNHTMKSDLYFPLDGYEDFWEAYAALMEYMENHQHKRSNIFFVNTTTH